MSTKNRKNAFPLLAQFKSTALDNFSFKKAIDTKNKMYKTMNFEGILEHPLQPNLVIYGKKRQIQNPRIQKLQETINSFTSHPPPTTLKNPIKVSSLNNSLNHTRINFPRRDTKTAIQGPRIRLGSTEELFQKFGQNPDYSSQDQEFIEYQPRTVIPLNLMNIGNIRSEANNTQNNKPESKIKFLQGHRKSKSQIRTSVSRPGTNQTHNHAYNAYISENLEEIDQMPELNMTKSTYENDVKVPHQSSKPHYIYIIPDGVDIVKDRYKIFKADIQPYLNSLLPKRVKKKFEFKKKKDSKKVLQPLSEMIREQVYKQFLADVTAETRSRREIVTLFDTQGLIIKDLMEITPEMKVFVSSTDHSLRGIKGIHSLDTEEYKTDENRERSKQAFLKACENWIDTNPVEKLKTDTVDNFLPFKALNLIQE